MSDLLQDPETVILRQKAALVKAADDRLLLRCLLAGEAQVTRSLVHGPEFVWLHGRERWGRETVLVAVDPDGVPVLDTKTRERLREALG